MRMFIVEMSSRGVSSFPSRDRGAWMKRGETEQGDTHSTDSQSSSAQQIRMSTSSEAQRDRQLDVFDGRCGLCPKPSITHFAYTVAKEYIHARDCYLLLLLSLHFFFNVHGCLSLVCLLEMMLQ